MGVIRNNKDELLYGLEQNVLDALKADVQFNYTTKTYKTFLFAHDINCTQGNDTNTTN